MTVTELRFKNCLKPSDRGVLHWCIRDETLRTHGVRLLGLKSQRLTPGWCKPRPDLDVALRLAINCLADHHPR